MIDACSSRFRHTEDYYDYCDQFSVLPDGRTCFKSRTRHHFACHVVGDQPQPGFSHVSPLFERDGGWLYYGIVDRHLYLMELPPATA
jgi:hypothetical protein